MKNHTIVSFLFLLIIIVISCDEDDMFVVHEPSDYVAELVSDEILSDINFADMLDEGDNGLFWGDNDFLMLKSAEVEGGTCPFRQVVREEDKKIITLEFSGEDCNKEGTIIIEHIRPEDGEGKKKKITYIDFKKNGITHNGVKEIVKGDQNYTVEGRMEIRRINSGGDTVHIVREFNKEIQWLCGWDTPGVKEDNIKQVTGQTDFDRTVNGQKRSFTRKILEPLLIVKECDFRIQAGQVEVKRTDGAKVTIDYGQEPGEIECDDDFDCDNKLTVTIGEEVYNMEFVDGKRVKAESSEE